MVPIQLRMQALRCANADAHGTFAGAFPAVTEPSRSASESPRAWRQAELKRAIAAAEEAGLSSYRVEIAPDGTISVIVGDPAATAEP